ncbi:SDR family oxidoreductase [Mycobacterium sp. GA-2829]|uniref:SDR family oxidoreductase n=1 Tax=Mycobacterium sp. GA-2829 TaxID=1772283 RepID=UPI00073FCCAC|nr:SDR family NAD(P)-dependent oxidoreductase [Mycobacterium sp. GA-2829]KUI29329.1 oxidoreductase [Mycobacterium sp. GA-2829]
MTTTLDGAVAVITGASSGIGAATARRLAAEGATVVGLARRADRLSAVAEDVRGAGGTMGVVATDLTERDSTDQAVERVVAEHGRIDILVNNAGVMYVGPVADAGEGEWEQMIATNLHAVLNITHCVLPHLTAAVNSSQRAVADIVNVSSTAGRVARPGTAVYSLTKFGLNAFSESLRQELLPRRVRVGLVEPGVVDTDLHANLAPGVRETIAQRGDAVKMLKPDDIADSICYMVTRPSHVALNEILVRPTDQTW